MHRQGLLQKLAAYQAADKNEYCLRRTIEQFVKGQARCFDRSLNMGHITGSALVVSPQQDQVLLTHHRKLDRWLQLGGHADGEPDVLAVALREAREESGLESIQPISEAVFDVDVHPIPATVDKPRHLHYDIRFLLQADPRDPLVITRESKDLRWIPLAQVETYCDDESVLRMVSKLNQRQPLAEEL